MNWGRGLAYAQIALCVGAAVGYLIAGDYRRVIYFLPGAGITLTVTA